MKQRIGDVGPAEKAPTADSVALREARPDTHVESPAADASASQPVSAQSFASSSSATVGTPQQQIGNHTPGPYRVWRSHEDNTLNISNEQGDFLCMVGGLVDGAVDSGRIRADADFIAEAMNSAWKATGR